MKIIKRIYAKLLHKLSLLYVNHSQCFQVKNKEIDVMCHVWRQKNTSIIHLIFRRFLSFFSSRPLKAFLWRHTTLSAYPIINYHVKEFLKFIVFLYIIFFNFFWENLVFYSTNFYCYYYATLGQLLCLLRKNINNLISKLQDIYFYCQNKTNY